MVGDCGVFYVGDRQVGGCHEWELSAKLDSSSRHGWKTHRTLGTKAIIKRWWLYENVSEFVAKFYWFRNDKLIPAGEYEIKNILIKEPPLKKVVDKELILII